VKAKVQKREIGGISVIYYIICHSTHIVASLLRRQSQIMFH